MNDQIKTFVSSTFEDLKEHRAYVIQALRDAGIFVDPMENWTADSNEPKEFSQERVKGCNLCILLVAFRRGHIPQGEKQSITQMEYRFAVERRIDVLAFLLDEDAPWPRRFDEMDRDPLIKEWRDELRAMHGVTYFGHEPSSVKIEPAIARWLKDRVYRDKTTNATSEASSFQRIQEAARKASDDFIEKMQSERVYLPHLYVQRLQLETHLSGFLDHNCTKTGMLMVGTSGIGKTNTICHIVKEWGYDPDKLGNDVVLLVGGSTLPGGNFDFRDILLDRLEFLDNFGKFLFLLDALHKKKDVQFVLIVDAIDKHPRPSELLQQLDNLVVQSENLPWFKIFVSIGEVAYASIRKAGFIPAIRNYYSVAVKQGIVENETTEIALGLMTNEEIADAFGKYRSEPGFCPTSPFDSLTNEARNAMRNPLFLRILMEVFNGKKIPRRVLTAEVLLEYCSKKVFVDPKRLFFINRLVDFLYDNKMKTARFDSLLQVGEIRSILLDNSPQSPYVQLLDEQVLEEQYKRISSILPAQRNVALTYDRLFEYLLLSRVFERFDISPDVVASLSEQAKEFSPLQSVLTTLLLAKIDEEGCSGIPAITVKACPDVMKPVFLDLLLELEQRFHSAADTCDHQFAADQVGTLVETMLIMPAVWIKEILVEFCERLQQLGSYKRAASIYKRILGSTQKSSQPVIEAAVWQGLGDVSHIFSQKQEALASYEEGLSLYRALGDQNGEQNILDRIGLTYLKFGDMDAARDCFQKSLEIDKKLSALTGCSDAKKGEAQSLLHFSEYYQNLGDIHKAIEFAELAKNIYSAIEDRRGLADAYHKIGIYQRRRGSMEEAKQLFKQSMEIYQEIGDKIRIANNNYNTAIIYHFQGKWDETVLCLGKALEIYREIGDKTGIANALTVRGEAYRQNDDFDNALGSYQEALKIYSGIGHKRGTEICQNNMGATYLSCHNPERALACLEKALEIQAELLGGGGEVETLAYLSGAELALDHIENALNYSNKGLNLLQSKRFSEEDIQLLYFYRFKILLAVGRKLEAVEALRLAYDDVMKEARSVEDLHARKQFIESLPLRKKIVEAWKQVQKTTEISMRT